jgi:hypothetical protein
VRLPVPAVTGVDTEERAEDREGQQDDHEGCHDEIVPLPATE